MTIEEFKLLQKADRYAWNIAEVVLTEIFNNANHNMDDDDIHVCAAKHLVDAYMEGYRQAKSEREENR